MGKNSRGAGCFVEMEEGGRRGDKRCKQRECPARSRRGGEWNEAQR